MTPDEYRRSPARHPSASALLITDEASRALLVRPTYKDGWEFPGGAVDPGETPWEAAVREAGEELGITCRMPPVLLCADWMRPRGHDLGGFRLVFDGGVMTAGELAEIRLPVEELSDWTLADPADAAVYLPPERVRRLRAAVDARATGRVAYLEDGHPVT
ncbi:NUDIX hydrolase [Microbispora sp. NBC_01189]|uniref:NUDIX hydrolase n=1 Tax=Microbispora sp. NBC_01189 TaxID=2903583 RepID=UPI002E10905D|nr:NUDIX hydrolase [Microbispora sp. NBC_01189]